MFNTIGINAKRRLPDDQLEKRFEHRAWLVFNAYDDEGIRIDFSLNPEFEEIIYEHGKAAGHVFLNMIGQDHKDSIKIMQRRWREAYGYLRVIHSEPVLEIEPELYHDLSENKHLCVEQCPNDKICGRRNTQICQFDFKSDGIGECCEINSDVLFINTCIHIIRCALEPVERARSSEFIKNLSIDTSNANWLYADSDKINRTIVLNKLSLEQCGTILYMIRHLRSLVQIQVTIDQLRHLSGFKTHIGRQTYSGNEYTIPVGGRSILSKSKVYTRKMKAGDYSDEMVPSVLVDEISKKYSPCIHNWMNFQVSDIENKWNGEYIPNLFLMGNISIYVQSSGTDRPKETDSLAKIMDDFNSFLIKNNPRTVPESLYMSFIVHSKEESDLDTEGLYMEAFILILKESIKNYTGVLKKIEIGRTYNHKRSRDRPETSSVGNYVITWTPVYMNIENTNNKNQVENLKCERTK